MQSLSGTSLLPQVYYNPKEKIHILWNNINMFYISIYNTLVLSLEVSALIKRPIITSILPATKSVLEISWAITEISEASLATTQKFLSLEGSTSTKYHT